MKKLILCYIGANFGTKNMIGVPQFLVHFTLSNVCHTNIEGQLKEIKNMNPW